jgi:hypothetical protein
MGAAIPPESERMARMAFLASRTNAWLSIPMLFIMAAARPLPDVRRIGGFFQAKKMPCDETRAFPI